MAATRVAVIGAGRFGRLHAQKYAWSQAAELVAVCEPDEARGRQVATEFGTTWVRELSAALADVDAVSVAVPTHLHHDVVRECLLAGKHVLVEKPITHTLDEADALISLADQQGCSLQVGHIERFSESYRTVTDYIHNPVYVESYRIAPFDPRIYDVNVVLDLMIHDIDLLLALVDSSVESVDAIGAPVVTDHEDIANTRLTFSNGCVANATASRISSKVERTMRIFEPHSYTYADFHERQIVQMSKPGDRPFESLEQVERRTRTFPQADNLAREIESFLACIATGDAPVVDGRAGREALSVALRISESLRHHINTLKQARKIPGSS